MKEVTHRIQTKDGTWLNVWNDGRVTNDCHESMIKGIRLITQNQREFFAQSVSPETSYVGGCEDHLLPIHAHLITHPRKYF